MPLVASLSALLFAGGCATPSQWAERTPAGVPYERIVYGTQGESKMIWVTCKALSRHFFEKARPACEQALATMRIESL